MPHVQLTNIYGNVYSVQNYNQLIKAVLQKWRRQVEGGEGRELVFLFVLY
jgi:inhibitor of KinA sporulation pathway (predicted exonuclease)